MSATKWSRIWKSASQALLGGLAAASAQAATVETELLARVERDSGSQRYPVLMHLVRQPDPVELQKLVAQQPPEQRAGRLLEALRAHAQKHQAALLKDLGTRGAEQVQPLVTVNAVAASLLGRDVRELSQRADLAHLRFNIGLLAPSRRAMADPCHPARPTPRQRLPKHCRGGGAADPAPPPAAADNSFDAQRPAGPGPAAVEAPLAWAAGITGKGVTVALVDTGVDLLHPDLAGRFRGGRGAWFDVHGEQARPVDRHGHGTQIAGLVLGAGSSGVTLGVAPQAQWIAARVYNDANIARLSDLHRVMAWLLDPDGDPATADAPQIALNAWGLGDRPGVCDAEFASDLRWLRMVGMHVVFAGGNGGPMDNSSVSPANNPGALAVGALDAAGRQALFSSRGVAACDARPYPDLMAPGELLRTTDRSVPGVATTTLATGTSYAAAVVAGELALLVQAKPQLPAGEREALLRPADPTQWRSALPRALGLAP